MSVWNIMVVILSVYMLTYSAAEEVRYYRNKE